MVYYLSALLHTQLCNESCGYYICTLIVPFSRKEKEIRKALETPEEKRARRLAKKEAKERKRRQKLGWDSEQLVG